MAPELSRKTKDRNASSTSLCSTASGEEDSDECVAMSLNEVINGFEGTDERAGFPGLLGLVNAYLNSLNVDVATKCELRRYLDLIKFRASGESCRGGRGIALTGTGRLVTPATWIRDFITRHPAYKQDSVVSDEITYDLAKAVDEM